jgi:hypothetical protein
VLTYDSVEHSGLFSGARATRLSSAEAAQVETLLAACIDSANRKYSRNYRRRHPREPRDKGGLIDLGRYNRQLIPALTSQREKEVWVHCLCKVPDYWRHRLISVSDGGNCFFWVRINLSRNTWYDLTINGEA